MMLGTLINVAGVVAGVVAGLIMRHPLAPARQQYLKVALGVYTVWIGLRLAVTNLHGNFWHIGKQLLIVVLAMIISRVIGRLVGFQRGLNRLGKMATAKLAAAGEGGHRPASDGFMVATVLFCAAPLAILGPIPDGLQGEIQPLVLKAAIDGLVAMSLAPSFRWPVLLGALPMASLQVSVTRLAQWAEPTLRLYSLCEPLNVVCGLLIFCLSLIIFGIRKVEVGDYLPALVLAPWLSWLWS